ncbi:MAG: penicillin-binding protein [Candidatus Peribacteraceae bacterium]|nr:penicillin-binding protein [Candidatus Peribacteraceae bacterium]
MSPSDGFHIRSMQERQRRSPSAWPRPLRQSHVPFLERAASSVASTARRILSWRRMLGWKRFLLRAGGIGAVLGITYLGFLWLTLPDVDDPTSLLASQSTVITDRNGEELYRLYAEQDRTYVANAQIADTMKEAIVAIEDERFYRHGCIEIRSIVRAVLARLIGRNVTGGASTLTQQLARNSLISSEHTLTRKLREAMLACEMERVYDKEKLLELYLNWIPFGQNAYGVEQASRLYFGVSAKDLTLAQSAVLAALPQRPSYFTPYGSHVRTRVTEEGLQRINAGKVKTAADLDDDEVRIGLLGAVAGSGAVKVYVGGRADQVLKNMETLEYITEEQRLAAVEELKTAVFKPYRENIRAPHFVLWVKEQVERLLEDSAEKGLLEQGGLVIQTTLDWKLQQAAEAVVAAKRDGIAQAYGAKNIALVSLDPTTREVLAYVGNADFSKNESEAKIDMARVPRQPGSSFKPFVYAAAFEKGYGPATVLYDVATKFGEDQPQNFDGSFWGLMNARQALGASRNIPAIKAFFLAGGEQAVLNLAERLGVTSPKARKAALSRNNPFDYGWPLAIGTAETPLLEMVDGYATIADGGMARPVISIRKITDKRGALIPLDLPSPDDPGQQALDPRIAYQVTSILSDVSVRPGEFWQAALTVPGVQAAAKTGTSNKCLDRNAQTNTCKTRKPDNLWTMGYTSNLVTGVWVGNATSEPLADKADGLNVAAPLWKEYMVRAQKILPSPAQDFRPPQGIVQPQISLLSGELPTECTPVAFRRADVFLTERAPSLPDPACVTMRVDRVTGLLASDSCPAEAQELRSFFWPHSILAERWPLWEQGVQAWARGVSTGTGGGTLPLPLAPAETCDMSKTPGRLVQPEVRILSPGNGGTATYPTFQPQIEIRVGETASGVTFLLDGKVVAEERSAARIVIRAPKSVNKEGLHTLEVILTDNYYNTAKDSVTFRFDEAAGSPAVRIVQPADNVLLPRGAITMEASADAPAGVKYVEFFLDDLLLTRKPREPYLMTYPDVEPGRHRIRAVVTDMTERTAEDSIGITVEP